MTRADDRKREHTHYMAEAMRRLEADLHSAVGRAGLIPDAWHQIAQSGGQGAKVKVTLWVERDVLSFFRSMGVGHTTRMADVLKTFMHARLAGLVKGPEAMDYRPKPEHEGKLQRGAEALIEAWRREREG